MKPRNPIAEIVLGTAVLLLASGGFAAPGALTGVSLNKSEVVVGAKLKITISHSGGGFHDHLGDVDAALAWVFDHMESGGKAPSPSFSPGGTHWTPKFSWNISPDSDIHYWVKIRARRPLP